MIQPTPSSDAWLATMEASARYHGRCLARRPELYPADRHDLAQELLLELQRQRPRFNPARSSSSTFANRVFRNRSIGLIREARATKRAHTREPGILEFDQQIGASDDAGLRDLRFEVRLFVASLPLDLQPLAELLQVGSQKEARQELGLSRRQMARWSRLGPRATAF